MSQTDTRPVSTAVLVGLYAAVFTGMVALLAVITSFVEFENSAMGLVIAFAAAMSTAQFWVSREKLTPPGHRLWGVAVICGLVTAAIMAGIASLGVLGSEQLLREIGGDVTILAAVLVGLAAVNVLVVRLGFWLGAKQATKATGGA